MTATATLPWLRERAGWAALAGGGAGLLLFAWSLLAPTPGPILAGWLVGVLFWMAIALGAFAWLATHALTGGQWGVTLWPALAPATATLPLFALLLLPLALQLGDVYPWVGAGSDRPEVARLWLNETGFIARGLVAVIGWSVLGLLLVQAGPRPRPVIGIIALLFHGVIITGISLDWILSIEPHFPSTAFPADIAVHQLLAALAWAAVIRVAPPGGRGGAGDLGALMLACVLGAAYLGFAQYLVIWYGNLPERITWYLERQNTLWWLVDAVAIALMAVLPFLALIVTAVRNHPGRLALVGACVLAGEALNLAWMVCPPFGALSLPAALLGIIVVGGLWVALGFGLFAPRLMGQARHA
jgi:hypothetical protein